MTRNTFLFAIVLAICILTVVSIKPFPKRGLYYVHDYVLEEGKEPRQVFEGYCTYILVDEKTNRYAEFCPKNNSTTVGFYNEETLTFVGAWQVPNKGFYGSLVFKWNGTCLKGPFTIYPTRNGYTYNTFVRELPPDSDIPTV